MRVALISARAHGAMIMWRMSRGIILHILLAHSRNTITRPFKQCQQQPTHQPTNHAHHLERIGKQVVRVRHPRNTTRHGRRIGHAALNEQSHIQYHTRRDGLDEPVEQQSVPNAAAWPADAQLSCQNRIALLQLHKAELHELMRHINR
jgi:hypothetical protein